MTSERNSVNNTKSDASEERSYAFLSFILGIVVGVSTIITGIRAYFAGWPAHGPVGVLGVFYIILGLLTTLGSIMVLANRARIVGAILVLVFGFISGPQSMWPFLFLTLGLLLPVASFAFALYAWKLERKTKAT